MTARKPDYSVTVMNKETGEKSGPLGAAWKNEDGSLNLKLNPGTALIGGNPDFVIRMWPTTEREETKPTKKKSSPMNRLVTHAHTGPPNFDDFDDDIPF